MVVASRTFPILISIFLFHGKSKTDEMAEELGGQSYF